MVYKKTKKKKTNKTFDRRYCVRVQFIGTNLRIYFNRRRLVGFIILRVAMFITNVIFFFRIFFFYRKRVCRKAVRLERVKISVR